MRKYFTLFSLIVFFLFTSPVNSATTAEIEALLELKSSLDPTNTCLHSWSIVGNPCDGNLFDGVGCNEKGHVANISLQGKRLQGKLSPAIGELKHLTAVYLHYNSLVGEIPKEITKLNELSDLYLNVNNFSGSIPEEIENIESLQVLQLCYNQLTGSIPRQLGSLKKLKVLALQSNQLSGAIPASLGDLQSLVRLDLSFNHLFGSIPTRLADAYLLEALDVQNNTLSGSVPLALKRLNEGFQFGNNPGLCGTGFADLRACTAADHISQNRPEPFATGLPKDLPQTANAIQGCNHTHCSSPSPRTSHAASAAIGVMAVIIALSVTGSLIYAQYRRRQHKLGRSSFDLSDTHLCTGQPYDVGYRKKGSPLISLEYPNGWDPLADGRFKSGGFSEEVIQNYRYNLEEVESATQHFSPTNLLGKTGASAVYKGILRDGTFVAVKRISKGSCKSEEAEFLKGLNVLTSLRHDNIVRLKGFCCSKGRGECFLIYDFIPNGNLLRYLDLKDGDAKVLEWSTRVSIINGIARGIQYLHCYKVNKPPLVHQNISASNVLLNIRLNPLLSGSGLHKLLTNDTVFSSLKASAAMGYLAPEYTTTGRLTEKSDVYAFGVLVLQIISGRRKVSSSIRQGAESMKFQDFIDSNLHARFSEQEAAKLAGIALSCSHESPFERPSMEAVSLDLGNFRHLSP